MQIKLRLVLILILLYTVPPAHTSGAKQGNVRGRWPLALSSGVVFVGLSIYLLVRCIRMCRRDDEDVELEEVSIDSGKKHRVEKKKDTYLEEPLLCKTGLQIKPTLPNQGNHEKASRSSLSSQDSDKESVEHSATAKTPLSQESPKNSRSSLPLLLKASLGNSLNSEEPPLCKTGLPINPTQNQGNHEKASRSSMSLLENAGGSQTSDLYLEEPPLCKTGLLIKPTLHQENHEKASRSLQTSLLENAEGSRTSDNEEPESEEPSPTANTPKSHVRPENTSKSFLSSFENALLRNFRDSDKESGEPFVTSMPAQCQESPKNSRSPLPLLENASLGNSQNSDNESAESSPPTKPPLNQESPKKTSRDSQNSEDLKKRFLQKLMALDVTARSACFQDADQTDNTLFHLNGEDVLDSDTPNPLDILCEVLLDADTFHQQEIVTKMSMCQFSVPLLLPARDGSQFTFMLWAMRDIVKKWTPHSLVEAKGFSEDNLVNISMPVISFAKLGTCNLSKSKLLNQALSPPEFTHNYFIHSDMTGGDIPRRSSDGLLEMSWYFPVGQMHLDIFPDRVSILNLRGDLEVHRTQFDFLTKISSAVFLFIETLNEGQYEMLSKLLDQNQKVFFIVNFSGNHDKEKLGLIKRLSSEYNLKKDKFLVKNRKVNDSQMVKTLQSKIRDIMSSTAEMPNLEQIAAKAADLHFSIDEAHEGCRKAKRAAAEISDKITNVLQYKKETMKLQGKFSKQRVKLEKELCRMRELRDQDVEDYKSQLQEKIARLNEQQSQQQPRHGVKKFLESITTFNTVERKLFLKWLKIQLDSKARCHLSELNDEYRKKLNDSASDTQELTEIDQKMADGSLGIEHFIRELGQMYEVENYLEKMKTLVNLPQIAAELLLDGFPLELVDGDASNIPLRWITDVLSELDALTERKCKIRVITVLGVQSTGKSTLLNTMFGLQYPVGSGRCTRGAFMTLLNAKDNFQEDLGCDYVMIIDTEGLKSMELASLDGSYEHDNELATLVVGLSDVTIVNMAMENAEEMKEILQIVVHAFLRMKEVVGKKSTCHFVHQNVSDVSAHVKNRRARERFLDQLNEMTKIAARMEEKPGISTFSDIIHCDMERHSWYIPGLWYGIPPMASINSGYSNNVQELKRSVIRCLQSMAGKPQDIVQFTEWIKSLWNAVKHEKFLFSFQNGMIAEAYNLLCIQYSDWEWIFRRNMHEWMMRTETLIFNLQHNQLGPEMWAKIQDEMIQILDQEERAMSDSLEKYFEDDCDNAHLLEAFRGDFIRSVAYIRKDSENTLLDKCKQTIQIQKEKCQIRNVEEKYINIIEEHVSEIMQRIRENEYAVNTEQLHREFETIWEKALSRLPKSKLEQLSLDMEILQLLKQEMKSDDHSVIKKLESTLNLQQYRESGFRLDEKHFFSNYNSQSNTNRKCAEDLASYLIQKCAKKATEIANTKNDFHAVYFQELITIINEDLAKHGKNINTSKAFELDLKLYILGKASIQFKKKHEDFIQNNDPRSSLEALKPQYFSIFENIFRKRNECQKRAKQFCNICLKPSITDHIDRHLGKKIVDDVLLKNRPQELKGRKRLQLVLLEELLSQGSCDRYVEFINDYETFMKNWISEKLDKHYNRHNTVFELLEGILGSIIAKIKQVLHHPRVLEAENISYFLAEFCNMLKEDLVIPQNILKVVVFQSSIDGSKQFASDIESYIHDLEQQILREVNSYSLKTILSRLTLKPQDELFRKVMGCSQQCPFCKAPCEAGGAVHKQHFASVHRPRGLAHHVIEDTNVLDHSICSSNVISNKSFKSDETAGKPHPYKDYQLYYPDWAIHPDTSTRSSDYWKFVLRKFNMLLADKYQAKPANLPKDWENLTEEKALQSLKESLPS